MKKIVAAIMALILSLSVFVPAVFAESGSEQNLYLDNIEYSYKGEITSNPVTFDLGKENNYYYYKISSEKSGFYALKINFTGDNDFNCDISDFTNGNCVTTTKENMFYCYESCDICYFKMGENEEAYALFYMSYDFSASMNVSLAYLGEINEVTYSAPIVKEEAVEDYGDDSECIWYDVCFRIIFENGESLRLFNENTYDEADFEKANSIKSYVEFFGKIYEVDVPIVSILDYISSVDLPDGFKPSYISAYRGDDDCNYPEYVTVNYTDGTSQKCELKIVQFFHGVEYAVYDTEIPALDSDDYCVRLNYDEGKLCLYLAGYEEKFDAEVSKQGFTSIVNGFFSGIYSRISFAFDCLYYDIRNSEDASVIASDLNDLFNAVSVELRYLISYLGQAD